MAEQLAKRATFEWVEYVLGQFNERALSEKQACQLLEIKRIQLYELRKRWLRAKIGKRAFKLCSSGQNQKRSLSKEIKSNPLLAYNQKVLQLNEKIPSCAMC